MKTNRRGERTVLPEQSNYGAYRVPASVTDLTALPLFVMVAYWGWRLGRPFCRDEVAAAFGIAVRQAGDVMSYIQRTRTADIATRHYIEYPQKGCRRRYLQILSEPTLRAPAASMKTAPAPTSAVTSSRAQGKETLQALRQWFLGRPNPPGDGNEE